MRRRKHRLPLSTQKALGFDITGNETIHSVSSRNWPNSLQINWGLYETETVFLTLGNFSSSDGPDPSSSDLSADTVIYLGPSDDATDGEHPPVYIPSMNSGDNRCSMNKALKGSSAEKQPSKLAAQKKTTKRKTLSIYSHSILLNSMSSPPVCFFYFC